MPSLQVLGYVMIQTLTCKMDLDDDFDDAFEDEEAYVLQQDEAWYSDEKMVKTKVYRYVTFEVLVFIFKCKFSQTVWQRFPLSAEKGENKAGAESGGGK